MAVDRALLLHRDEATLRELHGALSRHLPCDLASSPEEAMLRFAELRHAVVVVQHEPPEHDAGRFIHALSLTAPSTVVIALTGGRPGPDESPERLPGRVYRFLGSVGQADQGYQVASMVLDGLRLARLEREQRELVQKLDGQYTKLKRREKLLDHVVRERTRELENACAQLKLTNRQLLLGLAEVIEAKDSYTKGHCGRVANYTMALARLCGFGEKELELIEYASFLHDIGKVGVRDAVLLKPGPLGDDEWSHMRTHPVVGDSIASQIDILVPMRAAIRNHHERWDGSGYPDKLKGDDIPIVARIVAITDSFDAMITERPYKAALPYEECHRLLRRGAGKHFDPDLVEAFVRERIGEEFA